MERVPTLKGNKRKNMHPYEERYVAFIDILGFSSLVDRAESDTNMLERLASVLEEVGTYKQLGQAMDSTATKYPMDFFVNMFRMSTFSDNIIISTKVNPIGLGSITTLTAIICNRLLHFGIFTRGAISIGKLIHSETIVLGKGLIKAYNLEHSAAIYPRILLDDPICHDMDIIKQGANPDLRRQDFDGLWHLHILHPSVLDLNSHTLKSEYPILVHDYMALGRQEIENGLRSNYDLGVKSKIGWLAKYFNEYAVSFGLQKIQIDG